MLQLIKIQNQNGKQAVDARELHEFMEVQTPFHKWVKRRINEYDFIENEDFVVVDKFVHNSNGGHQTQTDYALSLDMAKELSMVERTCKGKQARRYFIACERALREANKPIDDLGDLIQATRSKLGITNRILANKIGVGKRTIERLISGREFVGKIISNKVRVFCDYALKGYDMEAMELLIGIDDKDVRVRLFEKFRNGGVLC
jgi:anti-repressor protein